MFLILYWRFFSCLYKLYGSPLLRLVGEIAVAIPGNIGEIESLDVILYPDSSIDCDVLLDSLLVYTNTPACVDLWTINEIGKTNIVLVSQCYSIVILKVSLKPG